MKLQNLQPYQHIKEQKAGELMQEMIIQIEMIKIGYATPYMIQSQNL